MENHVMQHVKNSPASPPQDPRIKPLPYRTDAADERKQAWLEVERVLSLYFHKPDIEAAKILFACTAAHRITDHPPAWLMWVAPPGSMKTVWLESLKSLALNVHFVDEVTANTFISGKLDDPVKPKCAPASLLHRIGSAGILVSADFGTIINTNRNVRGSILAQLRRIYDGRLSREFGSDDSLNERIWEGRLTLLVGVTPDVDKQHALFQALGERFLYVRSDRAGGANAALEAMRQTEEAREELQTAVTLFMLPAEQERIVKPSIPQVYAERLAALGEFVVRARADVPPHRHSRQIEGEPVIESNTRCPQQMAQVVRGWTFLSGRSEASEEDYRLAVRVAFDSIPPVRAKVAHALTDGTDLHDLDAPKNVIARSLKDLEAVKLVRKSAQGVRALSLPACKWLEQAAI